MGLLTRDKILKADDLKKERVHVPAWNGDVFVRTMTGKERDAFEGEVIREGRASTDNIRARLLVRVLVDEEGNRLFKDEEADLLGEKSTDALEELVNVAQMLNAMTNDDIEGLKKNSENDPSESSTSD